MPVSWSWPPFSRVTAYAGPAQDFAAADNGGRAHLLEHWAATPDADRLAFLEALRHNRIALDSRQQPFLLAADQRFQAAEGDALPDGEPKPLRLNNRLRGLLNTALASHQLVANEVPLRLAAAQQLQKTAKAAQRPLLEARLRIESDAGVKEALGLALANLQLGDPDPALRLSAVRLLGESGDRWREPAWRTCSTRRWNRRKACASPPPPAWPRSSAGCWSATCSARPSVACRWLDPAARGARPGDHLRPARVINMAHGEMLMLGAYSTLRGATAVPAPGAGMAGALPVAGATGGVLRQRRHRHGPERTVIRHLYGRLLEPCSPPGASAWC